MNCAMTSIGPSVYTNTSLSGSVESFTDFSLKFGISVLKSKRPKTGNVHFLRLIRLCFGSLKVET